MVDRRQHKFTDDEQGNKSGARMLLYTSLVYEALYVGIWGRDPSIGMVLTFFTALDGSLIVWAAGPRIAQYLAPQVGNMVRGVGDAYKAGVERISKAREMGKEDGSQPT